MSGPVTLVKLGGSVLTDKTRERALRREVLERLAGEVAEASDCVRREGGYLIVGHGSGSFGHQPAQRYEIHRGLWEADSKKGAAETQHAAAELHREVVQALLEAGCFPFSTPPSAGAMGEGTVVEWCSPEPLMVALANGLLPVVYGDVLADREQGVAIASTEHVLLSIARALQHGGWFVRRALWLGDTDGVLGPDGSVVEAVSPRALATVLERVGGSAATDVTGGMRLRLETAGTLARAGVESWIGSGLVEGRWLRVLAGEHDQPGTTVRVA